MFNILKGKVKSENLAKIKNITGEMKCITEEMKSLKKLMSLRKATSNELIKDLIGYDPETMSRKY